MVSVQELYELWATEAYTELKKSLEQSLAAAEHRSLLQTFAELEPKPGQLVLDIGARDAIGAITLARAHELRRSRSIRYRSTASVLAGRSPRPGSKTGSRSSRERSKRYRSRTPRSTGSGAATSSSTSTFVAASPSARAFSDPAERWSPT